MNLEVAKQIVFGVIITATLVSMFSKTRSLSWLYSTPLLWGAIAVMDIIGARYASLSFDLLFCAGSIIVMLFQHRARKADARAGEARSADAHDGCWICNEKIDE